MRRTRYVALPVRAWQYVGLLVVSLACLTVGLVSRDKEGRAGSLAGPELQHRAPHGVDACPNLRPFTRMSSSLDLEQEHSIMPKTTRETRDSTISRTSVDLKTSRARSVERVSRTRLQYRADFRSTEALDKQGKGVRNDFSRRTVESNFGTSGQSRARHLSNPENRLSRTFNSRFTDDLASQRSIERLADSNRRREISKRTDQSRERRTQVTIVRDSSLDQHRRSRSRTDRRDFADERRERVNRLDRHTNVRSNERRDSSVRSLKRSTDFARREISKNDLIRQRVRDSSNDRRSRDRRSLVDSTGRPSERRSTSVESRNREEARSDRRHTDQRIDRRLVEQRMSERATEQRASRRLVERTTNDRRAEQRVDRRLKEQRIERRLANRGEIRSDRPKEQRAARRLMGQRENQRLVERRSERRATEETNDRRDTDGRRSLAQRFNANRLQRTRTASIIPANDIRSEGNGKRLINRIHDQQTSFRGRVLNDARRSRSADREFVHSANRLSRTRSIHRDLLEDSTSIREHLRLPQSLDQRRNSRVSTDTRSGSVGIRDNVSSRSNDFLARTRTFSVAHPLNLDNSMKQAAALEAIRQALVIGLCTIYGLTMYYGKRSFISNFVAQVPRFIVW